MKKAPQRRRKMVHKEKEQAVINQEVAMVPEMEMEMEMEMAADIPPPRAMMEKEMKASLRADKPEKKMKKKLVAKKDKKIRPRFDEDERRVKEPRSLPVVRVYAHKRRAPYTPGGERSDFTETLYWVRPAWLCVVCVCAR
jgi:hypothetical protein